MRPLTEVVTIRPYRRADRNTGWHVYLNAVEPSTSMILNSFRNESDATRYASMIRSLVNDLQLESALEGFEYGYADTDDGAPKRGE